MSNYNKYLEYLKLQSCETEKAIESNLALLQNNIESIRMKLSDINKESDMLLKKTQNKEQQYYELSNELKLIKNCQKELENIKQQNDKLPQELNELKQKKDRLLKELKEKEQKIKIKKFIRLIRYSVIIFLIVLSVVIYFAVRVEKNGEFVDIRDGKKYKTIKIGVQTWMAENLNYDAFGNKCYENDPANGEKYGRLYDWETAKKVCPPGWHLPSDVEWDMLIEILGNKKTAGKHLKAKSGWNDYRGESGNGTDTYGFTALPGGYGIPNVGFKDIGNYGYWWSASESDASYAYYRYIDYREIVIRGTNGKDALLSARCVQDSAP
jgi:uncharacterized protein (TIGR02145 family)